MTAEDILCHIHFYSNFPTFTNSNSNSIPRHRGRAVTDGKKLLCSQDSPTPPLSDLHRPRTAIRVTVWGAVAEGVMIDSSVSSLAEVLCLFPSLKPYHHWVEKPVIPMFPHEKGPQTRLSSALTGGKKLPKANGAAY